MVPHAPTIFRWVVAYRLAYRVGRVAGIRRVGVRMGPNSGLGGGDKMYALLFETDSGELLAFMGFPFGTVRTAAVVAIAAKHMARKIPAPGCSASAGTLRHSQSVIDSATDQRNLSLAAIPHGAKIL